MFSIGIFAAALFLLRHILSRFHFADVAAGLARIPPADLLSATVLTAASYLALAGFDGLGAAYIGRRLSTGRIILISFISHAVSHSAGFATLTGGAIRLRMYSAVGLSPAEVAGVVAFCGLTFGLGACSLAALALLIEPTLLSTVLHLPEGLLRALGLVLASAVGGYMTWGALSRRPIRAFGRQYPVPPPSLASLQIMVAALDLGLASAALYVLLPEAQRPGYPAFVGAYVVANLLGLLAHVPGGLGVFDAAILVLTPGAPPDAVLGALLVFRAAYNLLPLGLAAVLLLLYELIERVPSLGRRVTGLFDDLGPPLLSILVFAAGGITVFAHAVPQLRDGANPVYANTVAVAETVAGTLLMMLARGLNRSSGVARLASLGLLLLVAALIMVRSPFAPRAFALAVLAVIVGLSGRLGRADDGSWLPPPSAPWILAIGAVLAGACWLTWWEDRAAHLPTAGLYRAALADAAAVAAFAAATALSVLAGRRRHPY